MMCEAKLSYDLSHLFHNAFLCIREHNHSGIRFDCNWERTLHRFDMERLSMVSVDKILVLNT